MGAAEIEEAGQRLAEWEQHEEGRSVRMHLGLDLNTRQAEHTVSVSMWAIGLPGFDEVVGTFHSSADTFEEALRWAVEQLPAELPDDDDERAMVELGRLCAAFAHLGTQVKQEVHRLGVTTFNEYHLEHTIACARATADEVGA